MTDEPLQIIARGPRAPAEAASAVLDGDPMLEGVTYSIIEEDEDRGVFRIDAYPNTAAEAERFGEHLARFGELQVTVEKLGDADWLAMALSGLPPVRAGRFFVFGMHDRGRTPVNTVNLRIEAGAAFGTGHHGSTVGCLAAFDHMLRANQFRRVLDVGAGTGVLAIAAARTGSRVTLGTDIDPVSVRISRENARVNHTNSRFFTASGLAHPRIREAAPYDLVFANILAAPLVWLSRDIYLALRPGGVAILSGLLRSQARRVLAAYVSKGFRLERRLGRDAWATLILRRR
jgi:ribosomal protein L11 methyltransferase